MWKANGKTTTKCEMLPLETKQSGDKLLLHRISGGRGGASLEETPRGRSHSEDYGIFSISTWYHIINTAEQAAMAAETWWEMLLSLIHQVNHNRKVNILSEESPA
jgi:hypothetical protein